MVYSKMLDELALLVPTPHAATLERGKPDAIHEFLHHLHNTSHDSRRSTIAVIASTTDGRTLSQQAFTAPHRCHPCGTQAPAELLEMVANHVASVFEKEPEAEVRLVERLEDFCVLTEEPKDGGDSRTNRLVSFDVRLVYAYPAQVRVDDVVVVSASDRREVFRFEESKDGAGSPHQRAFYVHQAPLEEASVSNLSHDDSSISQLSEAQVAGLVVDVAKHALLRMNLQRSYNNKITRASVHVALAWDIDHVSPFVTEFVPSQYEADTSGSETDLSHARQTQSLSDLLVDLVEQDHDEGHSDLLDHHAPVSDLSHSIEALLKYLSLRPATDVAADSSNHAAVNDDQIFLKHERAILVLADVIWRLIRYSEESPPVSNGHGTTSAPSVNQTSKDLKERLQDDTSTPSLKDVASGCSSSPSTQRAIVDVCTRGFSDAEKRLSYSEFLEPFFKAVNERELADYERCAQQLLSTVMRRRESQSQSRDETLVLSPENLSKKTVLPDADHLPPVFEDDVCAPPLSDAQHSHSKNGHSGTNPTASSNSHSKNGNSGTNPTASSSSGSHLKNGHSTATTSKKRSKLHVSSSGMRVGISSANASDNWTFAKLSGGRVLNMCLNLNGEIPVRVECRTLPEAKVVLSSTDSMSGDLTTTTCEFTEENAAELLDYSDPNDVLRMLKYALVFCGALTEDEDEASNSNGEVSTPSVCQRSGAGIMADIRKFADHDTPSHKGLSLRVVNTGPSRSGFASSSAVAVNLVKVLFSMSKRRALFEDDVLVGSMALLFENRLGLKSGRQDVDGLLPGGAKFLEYHPTTEFLTPRILTIDKSFDSLPEHLVLVDTGIARDTSLGLGRGLNTRHLSYLSRDRLRYRAIQQSLEIHKRILQAIKSDNFPLLGRLFTRYMGLREEIDPAATKCRFDFEHTSDHGASAADVSDHHDVVENESRRFRVLRWLFGRLLDDGLIHGGMFTGAMGGGVAMLVLTASGRQVVADANSSHTQPPQAVDSALDGIREFTTPSGDRPFSHLKRIHYSMNRDGMLYTLTHQDEE